MAFVPDDADMNVPEERTTERCCVCGKPGSPRDLGVWFVNEERRTVHVHCWIAAVGGDTVA